ncbi:MAG TPA: tetratricopeptide repeat protein [Flavobacterium sp.]|nr:tetratricopeptide repeat protein [Flavobacterium sp.]
MKNFIVLFWFFIFGNVLFAQNNDALFSKGIQAFEKKEYKEAVNVFSELIKTDSLNATLHYNLGTSYLKVQNTGLSIFHLEKALKLNPNHEQAKINLSFAEKLKVGSVKGNLPIPQQQMLYSVFDFLSPNTWAYVALGTMFLAVGCFIFYLFTNNSSLKKILFGLGIFMLILSVCGYFISKNQSKYLTANHYVIFVNKEAKLMTEPRSISKILLNVTEGSKGFIKDETDQWIKIQLQNDTIGWVEKNNIMQY